MTRLPDDCCCCSLEKGAVVVFGFHTIFVCLSFILCIVAFVNGYENTPIFKDYNSDGLKEILPIISPLMFVLYFGIGVCLIYGVHKGRRVFMLPWIVVVVTTIIVSQYYVITFAMVSPMAVFVYTFESVFIFAWICMLSLLIKMGTEEYRRKRRNVEYQETSPV